jgi:hypothetical protein
VRADGADAAEVTDEELTALALAADPDAPLDEAATPFDAGEEACDLLPSWYMPSLAVRRVGRTRRVVVAAVVGALLVISGAGLCVTYGFAEIAW